jgi:hypothetical protein
MIESVFADEKEKNVMAGRSPFRHYIDIRITTIAIKQINPFPNLKIWEKGLWKV